MAHVPVIDLAPWLDGSNRAGVAAEVDRALQDVGFFLVTGHGVPDALRAQVRVAARAFFALPAPVKLAYAVSVAGRGWLPPGVEANGSADGTVTPPDLKESFSVGADDATAPLDGYWFQRNVFPAEVPALRPTVTAYLAAMKALSDELLVVCATALGLTGDHFTAHTTRATHTFNINRYPPLDVTGVPVDGQFRIGPHADFGTLTVLDREPGRGGLQVWTADDGWQDAPFVAGSFTINTGDLLARWSGDRWMSNRHRVLPPHVESPEEDLVSLVYFYEVDNDSVLEPLRPPIGATAKIKPIVAADFLRERLDAITVG